MTQPFSRSDGTKITSNPSFAAVKSLTKTVHVSPGGHRIRFSTLEIPVSYKEVDKLVRNIHCGDYRYIIHVGVGRDGYVTLEKYASSGGYFRQDITGTQGPLSGRETFCTKLDVDGLEAELRAMGFKVSHPFEDRG